MVRLLLPLSLSVFFLACGTPCSHIAGAEQAATDKGKACGAGDSGWTQTKLTTCEQNLSKCSEEDMKWMDTYADCLQKLQPCAEGQGFNYAVQRLTCGESLLKISGTCAAAAL